MKKLMKYISITCLLTLLISLPAFAEELNDINNNKNETAIQYLYDNGVISGYPDGSFKPLNTVNRAELLKLLVGGKGIQPTTAEGYKNCFPDVKEEWFAPFVCYAKEQGWVGGYPDGTFRPANTVITVEAIKMAVNSQGYTLSENVSEKLYDDTDNNAWYAPYVKVAKDKGILESTTGNLGVAADVKRGGISETIYRSMYIKEKNLDRFPAKITSDEEKTEVSEDKPAPTSSETVSQKNAVAKAKSYLGYSAFSHNGLVEQLEYEQFSHADAVYGADNSGADWSEQAAKKAKTYMENSAFSRGGLIEQLKYEKFTQTQAEYGANSVGL